MLVHISSPPEGCACWRDVPLSPPGKNQLRARFAQGCVTARRQSCPSATPAFVATALTWISPSSKVRVVAATKRCARRDCRRRRVLHRGAAPPRLAHPGGSCETDLSTSNRQGTYIHEHEHTHVLMTTYVPACYLTFVVTGRRRLATARCGPRLARECRRCPHARRPRGLLLRAA